MPHWAEIDENNRVLRVTYGEGTDEETYQWLIDNLGGTWVRTYYDSPGQTYAGIGYVYGPGSKGFSAPAPILPNTPVVVPPPESPTPPVVEAPDLVPESDPAPLNPPEPTTDVPTGSDATTP